MVGRKGRTHAQIQGDVYRRVAVGKIVVMLPAVQRVFGFRYQSVLHNTAANSAAKRRTMETEAESTDPKPRDLAVIDIEATKSYMKENERWNSNESIVGDENEWTTTMKNWKTDIENLIKHNVDRKISEIDLSERQPQEIKTYLNEQPVRNGLLALADVNLMVVKILYHCELDIFGEMANGAITKCIQQVTSKYRVGIYVDTCLAYPRLTIMPSLSICLSLLCRI